MNKEKTMVGGHAHEITLATTWNRPRWNVQCHGTLQSQHEGLSNDLVMYARVSPGKPDIEVWEQANAGAKKLAIVLKITGTCCKCRRKAVETSGPNLSILIENGITFQDPLTQVTEGLWREDDKYGQVSYLSHVKDDTYM
ncbi:hypothetical protein B0H14DRAFT_2622684 [Mycena olivaceomarginata]|nr:hypothetical protein B0H14DRAFT_2622684 [Mycena olivaceomarginata]